MYHREYQRSPRSFAEIPARSKFFALARSQRECAIKRVCSRFHAAKGRDGVGHLVMILPLLVAATRFPFDAAAVSFSSLICNSFWIVVEVSP